MPLDITLEDLRAIAPQADEGIIASLVPALNLYLPTGRIDTPLRAAMFLAQFGEETDGYKVLHEYASGAAYEGRKDLGNIYAGDGVRFKGRGIAMLTGRANYLAYGNAIGVDLVSNPELAADPDISVRVAVAYWMNKGLNAWADRGDVQHVTYLINGGYNGLARRTQMYETAKLALAHGQALLAAVPGPGTPDILPSAPIAAGPIPNAWLTPSGAAMGASAAGSVVMASSGVQGPLAYALAAIGVIAALAGVYFLFQHMNKGKS